jgi:O-antigen/teichoic acid export membrane protein
VILVRVFDTAAFGTYKQLLLIHATLYAVLQLGLAESLYYFLPSRPQASGRYVANTMLGLAGAGALALAGLAIAGGRLAGWLGNGGIADQAPLIGAFIALTLAAAPLEIVLLSRGRSLGAAVAYGLSDVLRGALMAGAALVARSLEAVFVAAVAFGAVRLAVMVGWARREFGGELRPDRIALGDQLRYAVPFGLAALVETIQATYHQYAVAWRLDPAAFAVYAVGCLQLPFVELVAGPAANVMMVRMGEARQERDRVLRLFHDTTRKLALVFLPLAVLLVVIARDLIRLLFTDTYAASAGVFQVWCMTVVLAVVQTDAVLRVYAETRAILALNVLRLVLVATSVGGLLGAIGLPGAALATVAASVVAKGAALLRLAPVVGVRPSRLLPWKALAATAASAVGAAVPVWVLGSSGQPPTVLGLAATAAVYLVSYALLAAVLVASPEQRRSAHDRLARALGVPQAAKG